MRRFIPSFVICLIFAGPLQALDPERKLTQYSHTAWRIQDGFFSSGVEAIAQTTDGYLWLGTRSGLFRFDGIRFVPWAPPGAERFLSTEIRSLLGARDGSLWIGTYGYGLWHWNNSRLTGYLQSQESYIGSILESEPGSVWATQFVNLDDRRPLCEVGPVNVRCFGASEGIALTRALGLAKDKAGDLWTGGSNAVVKWQPRSSPPYESKRMPYEGVGAGLGVMAIVPTDDGSAWVGLGEAGKGLQHLVGDKYRPLVTPIWDSSSAPVMDLLKDRHDALWVATTGQGLYRIRDGQVEHFGTADGMSSDVVMKLFEDSEGDVWAATGNGLDVFRDLKVTTFSAHEGLVGNRIDGVLGLQDGSLWVASDNGLNLLLGSPIRGIQGRQLLPGRRATSLLEDRLGRLWIGADNTMSIYQDETFHPIKRGNGRPLGLVVGIAEDVDDNVWAEIGGPQPELVRIRDLQVREVLPASRVPAARRVAADPNGGIWLGLMRGDLARYRNGSLEQFHYPHHEDSKVEDLIVNPDGMVLAATAFGLLGWRNGKQQILTVRNGLPCDSINALINDGRGSVWLYTQCGLVQIADQELEQWWGKSDTTLRMRVLDAIDGVRPGWAAFQKAARTSDGKLWFANKIGLQMVDPAHLNLNATPPPVHVEEVVAGQRRYEPTSELPLPALTRDVAIRYTALSFVAPQKVLFRYRLDGQDKAWQDASTRREAFYTNLGPGYYTFHVIACNNDGVWNEAGAAWTFRILPAFYQTWWFDFLCLAAAAGLAWCFHILRLKQATAAIQARLSGRLSERERIARELHDTLLQGFSGLVLRFQAVLKVLPEHEPARRMMEQALDRADGVLLEGRQRVRDLREAGLSGTELAHALTRCWEDLSQGHSSQFSLTVLGTPGPLDPTVLNEAYRIAREALSNAFQHARASRIEAELTYSAEQVCLRIRDDGVGIDPLILNGGKAGHWGLSGMRERAEQIGAKLNVWSQSGAGTEVELTIPAKIAYPRARKESLWRRIRTGTVKAGQGRTQ